MEINDIIHGFTVTGRRELGELDAVMYVMRHERTGLEAVWLSREEENKTFSIAFETLPDNDTGVFHILEHSVLCGSVKYPAKEPFVELLKSSMNTFLNAMTYPDKTMYPVSSRNNQDFLNLIRVYLDAVFHPLIYSKPEIFRQEGWHYEFDENGAVSYKGVVFNEMKGAFADADELAYNAVYASLFPDTPYRFVSGGDPARIPDLSYEAFLDYHRRFYSPSNAYVFLDGGLDIDTVLDIMDSEYLRFFDRTERMAPPALQPAVDGGRVEIAYEPGAGEDPARKCRLVWGRVVGSCLDRERLTAVELLCDALCGDNQSPLRKAVLERGLAESVLMSASGEVLQPVLKLEVRNFAQSDLGEIRSLVLGEAERLCREGLDRNRLEASMANMEFAMRERDTGSWPQGLELCSQVMASWLYGGEPDANLQVGELFDSLRRKLDEGYFEDLLRQVFLENPHRCEVLMTPSVTAGEERKRAESQRLMQESARWTEEDRTALLQAAERLVKWQETPDTPEALAAIPMLKLSDVSPEPELIPTEVIETDGIKCLYHPVSTAGIRYISLFFDADDCGVDDLPRLSFVCSLLGRLATKQHSARELSDKIRLLCGALSFHVYPYDSYHGDDSSVRFGVSFSTLEKNVQAALDLVTELLTKSLWDEESAALDILRQEKTGFFQAAVMNGSSIGLARLNAQVSSAAVAEEWSRGFQYYKWMRETEESWNWDTLSGELAAILGRTAVRSRLTVTVTGGDRDGAAQTASRLAEALPQGDAPAERMRHVPWGVRREGILIPGDVAFAVSGGNLRANGGQYSGTALLGAQIVSLSYLWNVIRVQGGAYGAGLVVRPQGLAGCYSYRDPNAAQSLEKYRGAGDFLRQLASSGTDLTGFIISAVASAEPLLTPRMKGAVADSRFWQGISDEDLRVCRRELLQAGPDDMKSFADVLDRVLENGGVCVAGDAGQLDACGPLDPVERL